jgi:uncharacterized protein (TIGR02611 family)
VPHRVFKTLTQARRLVVAVIGCTVLAIGIIMIVLPGPAIVVIPLGLGILATEFIWARRLLILLKERLERYRNVNDSKKGNGNRP